MFNSFISHLRDNRGDENVSKMIWVAIVFVVGAMLLLLVTTAFKGPIGTWYNNTVNGWFADNNGEFTVAAGGGVGESGGGGEESTGYQLTINADIICSGATGVLKISVNGGEYEEYWESFTDIRNAATIDFYTEAPFGLDDPAYTKYSVNGGSAIDFSNASDVASSDPLYLPGDPVHLVLTEDTTINFDLYFVD